MSRRPTFDANDVAKAGLRVVRDAGWERVSVRAVASELHVSPMALYRIAPDAEALRTLVADAAASGRAIAMGDALTDDLGDWSRRVHRRLVRHPGLATFLVAHWTE